jgi:DNA polymerase III delta prime subunit
MNSHIAWVEKYRPSYMTDIIGHSDILNILKALIQNDNLINLIFSGPSGTGKTSLVRVIVNEYYGSNAYYNVLELNASDERGIETVRNRIKQFVNNDNISQNTNTPYKLPKLVILDEFDAMTMDAQLILTSIMDYSFENAKFIFICNYLHKVIQPILSRCISFRFLPIEHQLIQRQLNHIIRKENASVDHEIVHKISSCSSGDLRKAINTLQSVCMIDTIQTVDDFCNLQGMVSDNEILNIIHKINNESFEHTCNYVNTIKTNDNFSIKDLLQCIFDKIRSQLQNKNIYFTKINNVNLKKLIHELQDLEETISICIDSNTHLYAFIGIFYKYIT